MAKITTNIELDLNSFIENVDQESYEAGCSGNGAACSEINIEKVIIDMATQQARKELKAEVDKKIIEKLDKELFQHAKYKIDDFLNKSLETFIDKPIIVTDHWGDVIEKGSISDILKERFDKFWTEKVDSNGNTSGYSTVGTRIEWLVDQRIQKMSEKFTKDILKNIISETEKYLTEAVKTEISSTLADNIGVSKLIEKIASNEQQKLIN